jgi:hypothetical protein
MRDRTLLTKKEGDLSVDWKNSSEIIGKYVLI